MTTLTADVGSSSAPRLTRSNSFYECDDAMEPESDHHPIIIAPGIDQQQKKEPAGLEKQLKRVRRLHEDSSDDEDCGASKITSILDKGHKDEESIEQPASKKMRKWLDSDSESGASSESETNSNSQCDQRCGKHVEGDNGNVAEVEGSESEGEDQLVIEVDHESPGEASDGEMESVTGKDLRSPVQDTLQLVEDGDINHVLETEGENCGSLATLELAESAQCS